jgi:hypothetical protein
MPGQTNIRTRRNTLLRCIDLAGQLQTVGFDFRNSGSVVESNHNVVAGQQGVTSAGNGLMISVWNGSEETRENQLVYYTNPRLAASFYDLRPVAGQKTHWAFSGQRVGAYQRFDDVINGGDYPKIGPAFDAWKRWYDPTGQITS